MSTAGDQARECHAEIDAAVAILRTAVPHLARAAAAARVLDTPETFRYTNHWRVLGHELDETLPALIARLESFTQGTPR